MKLIEKLALEHAEKATHPEGDPHFRQAIQATWEVGFRKALEMALKAVDETGADPTGIIWHRIRALGEANLDASTESLGKVEVDLK